MVILKRAIFARDTSLKHLLLGTTTLAKYSIAIFHYRDNIVYRDKMDFVIETYRDIGFSIIAQP